MIPRINCRPPEISLDLRLKLAGCREVEPITGVRVETHIEEDAINLSLSSVGQYEIIKIIGGH